MAKAVDAWRWWSVQLQAVYAVLAALFADGAMIALDAWSPRSSHLGDGASPRTALPSSKTRSSRSST